MCLLRGTVVLIEPVELSENGHVSFSLFELFSTSKVVSVCDAR